MICWWRSQSENIGQLMRRTRLASTAAILLAASALTASCTAETRSAPTQPTPTRPTPAPTESPETSEASLPSATPDAQVSNGRSYAVTSTVIEGVTPGGDGHWHAEVGQVSEGDPLVAQAFNKAGEASARDQIDQVRRDAGTGASWTFEVTPALTFRPTAIAQLLTGVYYAQGAAHPSNYVGTVVIDSRTAEPITLTDLFADEQAGLERLSQQTKQIWPDTYGGGTPMADEPGNRPVAANFANWIPTAEGMELHFADYQFAHGLPVITVPWSALTDVLAPGMAVLAQR